MKYKEAFMSGDDEDSSLFGDVGGPSFDPEKALKELGKMGEPTKQGALFLPSSAKRTGCSNGQCRLPTNPKPL